MHGFFDRAGPPGSSRVTLPTVLPSAPVNSVGTPNHPDFAAQWPAYTYPCQRFTDALTNASA